LNFSLINDIIYAGDDEGAVRVWPLDFQEFYLQAQHARAVAAVNVSFDGLRVLVGTHGGTIGRYHLITLRVYSLLCGILELNNLLLKRISRTNREAVLTLPDRIVLMLQACWM